LVSGVDPTLDAGAPVNGWFSTDQAVDRHSGYSTDEITRRPVMKLPADGDLEALGKRA
jgi:hypothetical protein